MPVLPEPPTTVSETGHRALVTAGRKVTGGPHIPAPGGKALYPPFLSEPGENPPILCRLLGGGGPSLAVADDLVRPAANQFGHVIESRLKLPHPEGQ